MSYSNSRPQNPVSKFIEWNGEKGEFRYYEKQEEEGENVIIDMPFYFVVLDELNTITGYNRELQSGIYSNEVKNIKTDKLIIRSFKPGIHVEGTYNEIKGQVSGAKFAKSVYAMLIHDKETFEIVNFKLKGSAFSAWLDKKFNVEQFSVGVLDKVEKKNGNTVYFEPLFKRYNQPKGLMHETAIKMDKQLQTYFKVYKEWIENQKVEEQDKTEDHEEYLDQVTNITYQKQEVEIEENDDLPF